MRCSCPIHLHRPLHRPYTLRLGRLELEKSSAFAAGVDADPPWGECEGEGQLGMTLKNKEEIERIISAVNWIEYVCNGMLSAAISIRSGVLGG